MGTRRRQSRNEVTPLEENHSRLSDLDAYNSSFIMQFAERVDTGSALNDDIGQKSTPRRKYTCKFCDYSAFNLKHVLCHRRDVHNEEVSIYECDLCDFVSEYNGNYKKHYVNKHKANKSISNGIGNNHMMTRSVSPERLYKCKYCTFTDCDVETVKEHQLTHCAFTCHVCLATFDSHKFLKEHLIAHQNDGLEASSTKRPRLDSVSNEPVCINVSEYQCPYCNFTTEGTKTFRDHVVLHIGQKNFRCSLCSSLYKYRGDCAVHIKQKHNVFGKDTSCYIEAFSVEDDISVLAKNEFQRGAVSNLKSYGCGFCKYKSNYKADVRKHQARMHPSNNRRVVKFSRPVELISTPVAKSSDCIAPVFNDSSSTEQTPSNKRLSKLTCEICRNYTADSVAKLAAHQSAHSNLRPFKCSKCGIRANFRSNVAKHIRIKHQYEHAEILRIPDEEAAKTIDDYMKSRNDVKNRPGFHGVGSNQEFSYQCTFCEFQTNYSAVMENHTTKTHQISLPVKVEECSSDEKDQSSNVVSKRKSLRQQRGYKCPTCFKTFSLKFERDDHMNEVHYSENDAKRKMTTSNPLAFSLAAKRKYSKLSMRSNAMKANNFGTFKRLKCFYCFYRSNWKGDVFRHIRKEHKIMAPKWDDVTVLDSEEAEKTFAEYEATFGKVIRSRVYVQGVKFINYSWQDARKGIDAVLSARANQIEIKELAVSPKESSKEQRKVKSAIAKRRRSSRASVSFSKVNYSNSVFVTKRERRNAKNLGEPVPPKPYECIFCGYRSNWKSDVLKHLRYSHGSQDRNDLRTLSYEEACATIGQYEDMRLYRVPISKRRQKIAEYDKRISTLNESDRYSQANQEGNEETREPSNHVPLNGRSADEIMPVCDLTSKDFNEYCPERKDEPCVEMHESENSCCEEELASSYAETAEFIVDESKMNVLKALNIGVPENEGAECLEQETKDDLLPKLQAPDSNDYKVRKLYRCSLCHAFKLSNSRLRPHVILHNLGGGYHCSMCCFKSQKRSAVLLHVSCYHSGGAYVKSVLKHGFAELVSFHSPVRLSRRHRCFLWSGSENDCEFYYCDRCKFITSNSSNFIIHKIKHRRRIGAQFKCSYCGLVARSVQSLNKHKNREHSLWQPQGHTHPFRCFFCLDYETNTVLDFCQHLLLKHHSTTLSVNNDMFACGFCGENLSDLLDLLNHIIAFHSFSCLKDAAAYFCPVIISKALVNESICNDDTFGESEQFPMFEKSENIPKSVINSLVETVSECVDTDVMQTNSVSWSLCDAEVKSILSDAVEKICSSTD